MKTTRFLTDGELPFCKGCGHSQVTKNTEKALAKLGFNPLDVILVTDIGCHGIIDKFFLTHTVHGLHGRAVAIAGGISLGMSEPGKKIIVFIGDGGATKIGRAHV
jgi:2-oxoglutarate ferredoxin oxidoreductase subunit beta